MGDGPAEQVSGERRDTAASTEAGIERRCVGLLDSQRREP